MTGTHEIVTKRIDPTDSKYQLSEEWKPDKEGLWSYPEEQDGWYHAHNTIRSNLQDIIDGVDSLGKKFPDGIPDWACESIKVVWHAHEEFLHAHHSNEDNLITPFMKTRCVVPEKLTTDHVGVLEKIDACDKAVKGLKPGASVKELKDLLIVYQEELLPHLREEELVQLPLLRAYFTPQEFAVKMQELMKSMPKGELGGFIHYMTPQKFRNEFMKQEGIPFFVWYINFKGELKYYEKNILPHLSAVKTGEAPVKPGCLVF